MPCAKCVKANATIRLYISQDADCLNGAARKERAMRVTVESVNSAIDSITRDVHDMQNTIERFQSITRDIPLDRLEAMCDAERDGRLVVLSEKPMCYVAPYKPTNSELLAAIDAQNAEAALKEAGHE